MVNSNSPSCESTLPPVEPEVPGPNSPFASKLTDEFSCADVPFMANPGPLSVKELGEELIKVSVPAVIGSAEAVEAVRKRIARKRLGTMSDLIGGIRTPGVVDSYDRGDLLL